MFGFERKLMLVAVTATERGFPPIVEAADSIVEEASTTLGGYCQLKLLIRSCKNPEHVLLIRQTEEVEAFGSY